MEFEKQYIKCSKFQDTEAVIKKSEDKIKEIRNIKERQDYAQDILVEANTLFLCSDYNSKDPDCSNCHSISCKYLQEYGHLPKSIG